MLLASHPVPWHFHFVHLEWGIHLQNISPSISPLDEANDILCRMGCMTPKEGMWFRDVQVYKDHSRENKPSVKNKAQLMLMLPIKHLFSTWILHI